MTDGLTVMSLFASLKHKSGHGSCVPHHVKPKIIVYHLCQIALNQKLCRNFEKWCEFSKLH